jgi:hypothetical protein
LGRKKFRSRLSAFWAFFLLLGQNVYILQKIPPRLASAAKLRYTLNYDGILCVPVFPEHLKFEL